MPDRVRVLIAPDADRAELARRARSTGAPARVVQRARIVLLAAAGMTGAEIAGRTGCTEPAVIRWRRQYAERGLAGLADAPRGAGPVTVLAGQAVCGTVAAAVTPPPLTSVRQLTAATGAFTDGWNDHPRPSAWTKDADEILASIKRAKLKPKTRTKALADH